MERKDRSPDALSAGDVLIAGPDMPDGHFSRTLVYLKEHDDEGSLGLILNRPVGQTLGRVLSKSDLPACVRDVDLFFGGPVQTDQFLLAVFRIHEPTLTFRCEVNANLEQIEAAMDDPQCVVRAFLGYAGWGEGQLTDEISRRDWYWTAPDEAMIQDRMQPGLWELMATGDYRWQTIRQYLPEHPEMN
jgi:putative transcriptional regulator